MAYVDPNAALIADYADLGVSCGYVGNLEPWGDDRGFRVFTNLRSASSGLSVVVHVFPERAGGKVVRVVYDTPAVRARLDALRVLLAKPGCELYRVG